MPGGVHIVLTAVHPTTKLKMVAVGYKYSRKNTSLFIASAGAGSTTPGTPYEMKYHNEKGNQCFRYVDRPDLVSFYYENNNKVDILNQLRQGYLRLEKKWVTTSPYFRMETSRIGMCAVDTFSIAFFYNLFSKVNFNHGRQEDYWNTRRLGGVLSRQILHLACAISGRRSLLGSRSANVNTTLVSRAMKIKSADEEKRQQLIIDNKNNTEAQQGSRGVATRAGSILRKRKNTKEIIDLLIDSSSSDEEDDVDPLLAFKYKRMTKRRLVINQKCDSKKKHSIVKREELTKRSSNTKVAATTNSSKLQGVDVVFTYIDVNGSTHSVCKNPKKYKDKRGWLETKRTCCDYFGCQKTTIYYCAECWRFFCFTNNDESKLKCFDKHVNEVKELE
jgi:hypothetical protein